MKVFISSTYKDLVEYRAAAIRAVEGTSFQASKMEVWGALPEEPLAACLKEVEQSDCFIGIYALRYGFVPEGRAGFDHRAGIPARQKTGQAGLRLPAR